MFHLAEVFSCMPHPIAGLPGPLQLQLVNEMVAVMRHIERRSLLEPQPFLSQGGNMTVQVGAFTTPRAQGQHPVFWIDLRPCCPGSRDGKSWKGGVFSEMRWWSLDPTGSDRTIRRHIESLDQIRGHEADAFRGYLVKRGAS